MDLSLQPEAWPEVKEAEQISEHEAGVPQVSAGSPQDYPQDPPRGSRTLVGRSNDELNSAAERPGDAGVEGKWLQLLRGCLGKVSQQWELRASSQATRAQRQKQNK